MTIQVQVSHLNNPYDKDLKVTVLFKGEPVTTRIIKPGTTNTNLYVYSDQSLLIEELVQDGKSEG
jgi:hypothetical protein